MTAITTTHLDYDITYEEHTNEWVCHDLKYRTNSLASLKAKIDEHARDARRLPGIKALLLGTWDAKEVTLTMLADVAYNGRQQVWVMDGRKRTKEPLDNCAPLTAKAEIEAWHKAKDAASQAMKNEQKARNAIPRFTAEVLKASIKEDAA